jgi:hypothetical protein
MKTSSVAKAASRMLELRDRPRGNQDSRIAVPALA